MNCDKCGGRLIVGKEEYCPYCVEKGEKLR